MTDTIDVIVPRGGKGLVGLVQREARVPVFAHLEGIVHIYIDAAADPEKALKVVLNAKTRRTGICGAAECLLIHEDIAETIGQGVIRALMDAGVEVRADERLAAIEGTQAATEDDWGHEYLDMKIAAKTVGSLDDAMEHIRRFGSNHTDAILTEDDAACRPFLHRARQRDPDAQRLDPVRRWRRVRDGGGDRHRHRQDARPRPRGRGTAHLVQIPGRR